MMNIMRSSFFIMFILVDDMIFVMNPLNEGT